MNKYQAIKMMSKNGDSIVIIRGEEDICATTDFSTKYIRDKRIAKIKMEKSSILVWSWTEDTFRNIQVDSIKGIKPLSEILNNAPAEEKYNG